MKYIFISGEFGEKFALPLNHPAAGLFLSLSSQLIRIKDWSGDSKLSGKYEYGIPHKGEAVEIEIRELDLASDETILLHKEGPARPIDKPAKPTEEKEREPGEGLTMREYEKLERLIAKRGEDLGVPANSTDDDLSF